MKSGEGDDYRGIRRLLPRMESVNPPALLLGLPGFRLVDPRSGGEAFLKSPPFVES